VIAILCIAPLEVTDAEPTEIKVVPLNTVTVMVLFVVEVVADSAMVPVNADEEDSGVTVIEAISVPSVDRGVVVSIGIVAVVERGTMTDAALTGLLIISAYVGGVIVADEAEVTLPLASTVIVGMRVPEP
jgi:hypothetical protein